MAEKAEVDFLRRILRQGWERKSNQYNTHKNLEKYHSESAQDLKNMFYIWSGSSLQLFMKDSYLGTPPHDQIIF